MDAKGAKFKEAIKNHRIFQLSMSKILTLYNNLITEIKKISVVNFYFSLFEKTIFG